MSVIISLIQLSLAATSAASVVPLSNGVHLTYSLYNITNAPRLGAIDPRFTTDFQQGRTRLSATSYLMSAANAMMELALENFTEPIRPRNLVDPGFPEFTVIPVAPGLGQRIEARYLLWGVWEGIRWMINHQSFRDLVIGAYWDGVPVCRIWITDSYRELSIVGSNGTLDLTARSEMVSNHNVTEESARSLSIMDVINPLGDQHLTVTVVHVGASLTITDVFITIFAALEYMAHFASTDEVADFRIVRDSTHTTLGILGHEVRPPFLDYQWVILSVGQIAGYMLHMRRFTDVDIEIAVDGVLLGEGFLSKRSL